MRVPAGGDQRHPRAWIRAGLLAVGRRDGPGRGLGEVAHFPLHHAVCPEVVVPYE